MRLTYTIEGYDRCRQRKLPSMPSHERMLNHPDDSDNDLHRDIRATGMDGRRSMGSVRKWSYGGRDHFWMFLVPLCSSSLLWISARYKWRRHGFLPPSESQVKVDLPRVPHPPKGHHGAVSIGCGTYGFVRLCT